MNMALPQANILIVEDDPIARSLLSDLLTAAGYKVTSTETIAGALIAVYEQLFDLVLLETVVGNDNGLRVAQAIRRHADHTAIVILTKQGALETAIQAIEVGVRAYLLKPQDPTTLTHTVAKHVLHTQEQRRRDLLVNEVRSAVYDLDREERSQPPLFTPSHTIISGQLQMSRTTFEALFGRRVLHLTTAEFDLLWVLVEADGHMVQAHQLVQAAFGYTVSAREAATLIKPHISHLRYKLEPDPERPYHIVTVRGKGYLWRP